MDRNVVLGFCAGSSRPARRLVVPIRQAAESVNRRDAGRQSGPILRRIVPPRGPRRAVVDCGAATGEVGGTFEQVVRKIAEYSGDGVIRCEVGKELEDGPVDGLGRAWVEDGVLVGSVEDPQGERAIAFRATR